MQICSKEDSWRRNSLQGTPRENRYLGKCFPRLSCESRCSCANGGHATSSADKATRQQHPCDAGCAAVQNARPAGSGRMGLWRIASGSGKSPRPGNTQQDQNSCKGAPRGFFVKLWRRNSSGRMLETAVGTEWSQHRDMLCRGQNWKGKPLKPSEPSDSFMRPRCQT